jgi:threonine dehydratase
MGVEIERVLCCCGGGGLLAGVAIAMRNFYPDIEIIGVEPETQADTLRSLKLGHPISAERTGPTLCDSLMSPMPGALTFAINQRLVNDIVLVSDDDVATAMRYAFTSLKSVLEPGGAAALGAYLAGKAPGGVKNTLITASGGNVDRDLFARILSE